MKVSRRKFLKASTVAATVASTLGCDGVVSYIAEQQGQTIPEKVEVYSSQQIDSAFHLLSRAAYGPWPGDIEYVKKIGETQWLEEQLNPTSIDDSACEIRSRRFETIHHTPDMCYEYKKKVLREEMNRYTMLRAIYTKRQLFESMVHFWSDHLNIDMNKGDCIYLKPSDDQRVIRPHALGNFRDLIRASALSPAMLVYLDGKSNQKKDETDIPNENYARELLELHTLGVEGGYTQKDVLEVARCLTGWRLKTKWGKGKVFFRKGLHDDGEKIVLGHKIPAGGGEKDLEQVLDIVCFHPSTAKYIGTKLVRRFVSDDPNPHLVASLAKVFLDNKGEITPVVRALFQSEDFQNSAGKKFKRPMRYIVSSLRLLGADTHAHKPLLQYLYRMGQELFQYPTPDGYPEEVSPWLGTLLWRWNFAFAVTANEIHKTNVRLPKLGKAIGVSSDTNQDIEKIFAYLVGRKNTTEEILAIEKLQTTLKKKPKYYNRIVGLILASPAFQKY